MLFGGCRAGLKSAGLPWSFQQLSRVCHGFLQWSHQGLPFFLVFVALDDLSESCVAKAELSPAGTISFNITCLLLSSRRISAKASRVLGNGSLPKTRLRTSSNSLFKPARNSNTLSFSSIFWYMLLSVELVHSSSVYKSTSCQRVFKVVKY